MSRRRGEEGRGRRKKREARRGEETRGEERKGNERRGEEKGGEGIKTIDTQCLTSLGNVTMQFQPLRVQR